MTPIEEKGLKKLMKFFSHSKKDLLILLIVFVLLIVAVFIFPIWYDEAGHFIVLENWLNGNGDAFTVDSATKNFDRNSGLITMGFANKTLAFAVAKIFGLSITVLRFLSFSFSFGLILVLWKLYKSLFPNKQFFWFLLIFGFNIQFLSYGTQFVGEPAMLFFLFTGIFFQIRFLQSEKTILAILAFIFFQFSILSKEYIAITIGLSLFISFLRSLFLKNKKQSLVFLVQGFLLPIGVLLWYFWKFDGINGAFAFLESRLDYSSEFFAMNFTESPRYLLFKPQILLGILAILLRLRFQMNDSQRFLAIFQMIFFILFLFSAGYERFGYQLLFISGIFLSEFLPFIYKRHLHNIFAKITFSVFIFALFSQNTFTIFYQKLSNLSEKNQSEKNLVQTLEKQKIKQIFTYEHQIYPFLLKKINFRSSPLSPHSSERCQPLMLKTGEVFVEGEFAKTEFPNCYNTKSWKKIYANQAYTVWQKSK